MSLEIIRQLNWVDFVAIILIFRICYASLKSGVPAEFFKLLGTICAIYLALQYYTFFSDWVIGRLNINISREGVPLDFMDFVCFVLLAISGYLAFMSLRILFCRFIKMEAVPQLNKWGGLVFGIVRGFLLVSLIIFALAISTIGYLRNSVIGSSLSRRLYKIAPATYSWLWDNITSKFMRNEKFNKTIIEVSVDLDL